MATEQVFLSYSLNDREACTALRSAVEQAGLSVFRDEASIRVGDKWIDRLQAALQSCSAFVLLVGRDGVERWVGAEAQVALIRHLSPHDDAQRLAIFPILLEDAKPEALPPFLALFQATRWRPAEPLPDALVEAIRARATPFDRVPFEGCPFLGLNAFQQKDARLFFGRRQEALEALACLGDQQQTNPERLHGSGGSSYCRWLQIEGNSGSGKSSLVNAGMLPMIERGALWARTGFGRWRVLGPMLPGKDPLGNLATALDHGLIPDASQRDSLARLKRLEQDERALAFALRDARQSDTAFLLIVDQFEELFTFAEAESRKRFDAQLANALQDPECPLFAISTVRADFLDRFEQLPRLQAIYNSRCKRFLLPTISQQGLREVIEGPARLANLDVREVTALMLEDSREELGALPLVENALYTLWRSREGNRLSGDQYRQHNGIAGMLSAQADALLERINQAVPNGKQAALELLLRLTRINDEGRHTRQRITRGEAVMVAGNGNDANGERVVQLLSGERALDGRGARHEGALRLMTTHGEHGEQYVDLIHETLIRARTRDEKTGKPIGYWPTLYAYVEQNRDRDLHRQQLKFQTEQWLQSRGLGRYMNLAGWRDIELYQRLRTPRRSSEARFLAWSRRVAATKIVVVFTAAVLGAWTWWDVIEDPLVHVGNTVLYSAMLPVWAFGLAAPLPETVDIASLERGRVWVFERRCLKDGDEGEATCLDDAPPMRLQAEQLCRIGKYEVTNLQYKFFLWETRGRSSGVLFDRPSEAIFDTPGRPVIHVSITDARAYTRWLHSRTGKPYRLPTEWEWEIAARGGIEGRYPWGNDAPKGRANCRTCGDAFLRRTLPVGRYAPNGYGLFDMAGNAWEWVESGDRKESKGTAVLRGGGWGSSEGDLEVNSRFVAGTDVQFNTSGFRVCLGEDLPDTGSVSADALSELAFHADPKEPASASLLIRFPSGSADLTPTAKSTLDVVARAMRHEKLMLYRFRIEGHIDLSVSERRERDLSLRRAEAVVAYLTELGIRTERLRAVGLGSNYPLSERPSVTNSRVTIVNEGQ
ncbi:MAG: SUMF1/EgtB/PvdO family nonheme iron enzyme [Burkholderiales bacterium]|nr:SUMF1/EgtB/PvdO family nonheme iron enzyme [Burkholderiales bacterium]